MVRLSTGQQVYARTRKAGVSLYFCIVRYHRRVLHTHDVFNPLGRLPPATAAYHIRFTS